MSLPYEPHVYYNCDDPDCCYDGSPQVICKHCKHDWPCADYLTSHTLEQVNAQKRWVVRVKHRVEFPDLIEYHYQQEGIEPTPHVGTIPPDMLAEMDAHARRAREAVEQ